MLSNPLTDAAREMLKADVRDQQGEESAGGLLLIENAGPQSTIEPLQRPDVDGLFAKTEESIVKQIRMCHSIPVALFGDLVTGKMGSGTELEEAFIIYNQWTAKRRKFVQREMQYLFYPSDIAGIQSQSFELQPLTFQRSV